MPRTGKKAFTLQIVQFRRHKSIHYRLYRPRRTTAPPQLVFNNVRNKCFFQKRQLRLIIRLIVKITNKINAGFIILQLLQTTILVRNGHRIDTVKIKFFMQNRRPRIFRQHRVCMRKILKMNMRNKFNPVQQLPPIKLRPDIIANPIFFFGRS